MILATAVVEKLHTFFPAAKIHVLVRRGNESLLANHPFIVSCLVWDKRKNKIQELFRLLRIIRNGRFDLVVNLQRFASSGFLTAFSRAKERVGFNKNPFSFLFDRAVPHVIGSKNEKGLHEVERCLQTVQHLTNNLVHLPKLYPSSNDEQFISGYASKLFITISPASIWFTKQTPEHVWIDFIGRINHHTIYLLGAPGDRQLCERIAAKKENVVILAGKLSLLQSAALMKHAQMNYTNDSAPMHLCSAVNAPVTAVYCSTIPEFGFGPLSDKSFLAQSQEVLPCKPCGLHGHKKCPLDHFKCGNISSSVLLKSLD